MKFIAVAVLSGSAFLCVSGCAQQDNGRSLLEPSLVKSQLTTTELTESQSGLSANDAMANDNERLLKDARDSGRLNSDHPLNKR